MSLPGNSTLIVAILLLGYTTLLPDLVDILLPGSVLCCYVVTRKQYHVAILSCFVVTRQRNDRVPRVPEGDEAEEHRRRAAKRLPPL